MARRYDEETLAELRERLLEAERGDPWPEWFTEDRVDVRWPKWDSALSRPQTTTQQSHAPHCANRRRADDAFLAFRIARSAPAILFAN